MHPLLESIALRAPLSQAQAQRAADATLWTLARRLPRNVVESLDEELGSVLSQQLSQAGSTDDVSVNGLYREARIRESVDLMRATEDVQVVCAALARELAPELRERVVRALPSEFAQLFEPREFGEAPPHVGYGRSLADARPGSPHSLSQGRAGSRRPLSEGTADRTQRGAVGDPERDTKLSSAKGLTQEREGDSLAEGHPGRTDRT